MDAQTTNGYGIMPMTKEEFALFRDLIDRESGIVVKGDKRLTLHAKLSHRLVILGISSYTDYYNQITSGDSKEEIFNLLSHVTNCETYFRRDTARIDVLSGLLSEVKRNRQKKSDNTLTILSAGCSSGEEVYTLNIMLMESGLFAWGWDLRLIGIDVNRAALKKAREGVYTKNSFRLSNGDREFCRKYFDERDGSYILKKPYRANVEFRHGNILSSECLEGIPPADVIFCRNVFIYMSDESIGRICENLFRNIVDDGYLFIGSSESLLNKTEFFIPEYRDGIIVYRKNPSVSL